MKCRLTRVAGGAALRTESMEGEAFMGMPVVGDCFWIQGKPLDPAMDGRVINTSPVVSIDGEEFTTESGSVYRLEIL